MRHAVGVRIAYLISWRGGEVTGPFKKMASQADAWSRLGHEVTLFVTTSPEAYDAWSRLPSAAVIEIAGAGALAGIRARRRTYRELGRWRPDVVYLRHGVFAPGLGRLVRQHPTVLEINADEVAIARQTSRLKGTWTALTRPMVLKHAVGAVFMSQSLATDPGLQRYGFQRLVLPNGIDLAAAPEVPSTSGGEPRLVLLGHPHSPWHGADKLVALARRHPTWSIDVIGPVAADLGPAPPPSNITIYPQLPTERYLPLLAQADVGIGTLAMHRIGVDENPALKVREYLALGLAVIIGCRDPDFVDRPEFLLELPNTETNLDDHDQQITEFVTAWRGRRVGRRAVAHLDINLKEAERLAFLQRFAAGDEVDDPPTATMTT
jgi:hypothetical protein